MSSFHSILSSFDYPLPPELIAKEPASPRDSARLLICNRKNQAVTFDRFSNIIEYLPENAVLVFNRTKVIPAKMTLRKITGGAVSALLLSVQPETITVLASGTLKPGDKLIWQGGHSLTVINRNNQEALLKPSFPITELRDLLDQFGETPLPPYLKDSPLPEDRRRSEYQTVFATENGSVAAPTAGLHFTESLINNIEQSGRGVAYVTLHVHLGTFAPLTEEQWIQKKLHTEHYSIDEQTASMLNRAKADGRPIIAVGTTTVRTLESASNASTLVRLNGSTGLFLTEESSLHFVDHLITNFHVPKSSLLMLVSAFTGREKLFELYDRAIKERMRFFSFGDGMMVI
ncbi:MAG: tRNA preQ1(34) S-adenosylmethionine ribosyltransferase-isomerase QueA [Candidatus Peribacteraceae bacterium]|nr:tRNA preQ1(34) S-adenosylmethionine ribosyltransferase-isomerase QueA [Candidatus Peribacteraceae bacterium]